MAKKAGKAGIPSPRAGQSAGHLLRIEFLPLKTTRSTAVQRRPAQSERKAAFFPRNVRPYGLKRLAVQTENALKEDREPPSFRYILPLRLFSPSASHCDESIGGYLFSSLLYWAFFRSYADAVILSAAVSASWRGGDRRPGGAAAPTPPGSSSRALRGTAGGRRPYDARQKGEKGRPEGKNSPVSDGCPKAGLGVVGGKGLASPLPPAPRREATRPRCRAEAAVRRTSQKKQKQRLLPASNRAEVEYAAGQGKNSFSVTGFLLSLCRCRHPVCCRKRVMARRRSPPRVGGSSDAARKPVPRLARDSERAKAI